MIGDVRHIHMVGICGTAMGGVATLLAESGYTVTGSDAEVYPPMSVVLKDSGILVMEGFGASNLEPTPDLVVIGNAMSRGNEEVEAVLERHLPYVSLAELLKNFFIRGARSLVVTGTHGKTTTASLLAWILDRASREPGFMIGGVPEGLGSGARIGGGELFVTEGDEYDTAFFDKRSKFLHYLPDYAILNNLEFDHADIFDSIDDIELSFARFLNLVPRNGLVVANADDARVMRLTEDVWSRRTTFSTTKDADWTAHNVCQTEHGTRFRLVGPPGGVECTLKLGGMHNVGNALGAAAVADRVGLSLEQIATGIGTFEGVKRRLQRLSSPDSVALYDDFAHHPTAIRETLRGLRARHPESRVWALFEPRSNTSVRNIFQTELIAALGEADTVIIGALHRRDKIPPDERLDVDLVVSELVKHGTEAVQIGDYDEILERVAADVRPSDVIVLMSNGAFGGLAERLPERLRSL
jgi:UDP-N-acetylmuramate: L-alanyl-gamma-D-glutamyl-meso-diaminopimelate ligase